MYTGLKDDINSTAVKLVFFLQIPNSAVCDADSSHIHTASLGNLAIRVMGTKGWL